MAQLCTVTGECPPVVCARGRQQLDDGGEKHGSITSVFSSFGNQIVLFLVIFAPKTSYFLVVVTVPADLNTSIPVIGSILA